MVKCECQGLTIKLLFIRHGFSCANMMKASGRWGRFKKAFVQDPPLTNRGIKDITAIQPTVEKELGVPDIVLSSTLLRAQQTANFLFPTKTVIVAPFIKELGSTYDNKANTPNIQKQVDKKAKQLYNSNRIHEGTQISPVKEQWNTNYFFVTGKHSKTRCLRNAQVSWATAQEVNYNKFIFWLEDLIPCLFFKNLLKINKAKPILTIAVVGHSSFMAKYIETMEKGKPNNVGIVELYFCLRKNINIYTLHKIKQDCGCPGIKNLKSLTGYRPQNCNGVVFRGIPTPKTINKNFNSNCKILT